MLKVIPKNVLTSGTSPRWMTRDQQSIRGFYIGRCMYVRNAHMTVHTQISISDSRRSVRNQIKNILSIVLVVHLETFC